MTPRSSTLELAFAAALAIAACTTDTTGGVNGGPMQGSGGSSGGGGSGGGCACQAEGESCLTDADCAGGLFCNGGSCGSDP